MITEPEMSDDPGGGPPGDVLSDVDQRAGGAAAFGRRRPWLWAAGGIAVASAVWAAVLHGTGGTTPDQHGYHLRGNPCAGSTLSPLTQALDMKDADTSDATISRGPALDRLSCLMSATSAAHDGWVTEYAVSVGVELHKRTDPRAEFENIGHVSLSTVPGSPQSGSGLLTVTAGTLDYTSGDDAHPVTGIGDEAYLVESHGAGQTLEVLHGGAVLSLQVSGFSRRDDLGAAPTGGEDGTAPPPPDLTGLRPSMTEAMRHLMTSLSS